MSIKDLTNNIIEEYLISEIDRENMPQIKGKNIPEVLDIFKTYGIPYKYKTVNINDLVPVQSNVIKSKIDNIAQQIISGNDLNPIWVSIDYHIIDGHHRWLANKKLGKNTMKIILVGYPKNAALKLFDKLDDKLNEAKSNIDKVVAVYSGRFQPFHRGHYSVYEHLVNKFGKNNVFIGTSNKIEPGRSPFSFREKQDIISTLFNIPKKQIVQVRNPYAPEEVLNKYNSKSTAFVTAFSDKDAQRLTKGKYFDEYKPNKKLYGYLDKGYYLIAPEFKMDVAGGNVSGTQVRKVFSSSNDNEAKKLFNMLYGKFDKKIYDLFRKKITENMLLEGGAAGHMAHPFEDMELTFGDLKNMINLALEGKLDATLEKLDGQNLMVSWIDGKLKAARNASHIKNFGKAALDFSGISNMFAGRGPIEAAFKSSMKDLQSAISKLSPKQKEKIFANGKKFMNLEIMYPQTTNVVPYGISMLIFHGTVEYDEQGNSIGANAEDARILAGMIKQINSDIQKTFTIKGPQKIIIPKSIDFSKQKPYFTSKLNKLQSKFGLKDTDQITLYHQSWWEDFINNQASKMKFALTNDLLMILVKRWAFDDKSESIVKIKQSIEDEKFRNWVDTFDKTKKEDQLKSNIRPFEIIFLELGTQVLKNIQNILTSNPDDSLNQMRSQFTAAIADLSKLDDPKKIKRVKDQLQKLQSIGGIDAILPTEGITFIYNGKMYKLTGAFAPLNQILGLIRY